MSLEPYMCYLDSHILLKLYLYKNVRNIEEIKNNIVKKKWNCAAINPSLILDVLQVAVAANRATISAKANTLITKSVFSEILFNLSLSTNISQSLTKFGITKDNNLLLCFFIQDKDESGDVIKQINGEPCPISDLCMFSNLKDIKSIYKLNNVACDVDLLDIIVSRIATKGIISF